MHHFKDGLVVISLGANARFDATLLSTEAVYARCAIDAIVNSCRPVSSRSQLAKG